MGQNWFVMKYSSSQEIKFKSFHPELHGPHLWDCLSNYLKVTFLETVKRVPEIVNLNPVLLPLVIRKLKRRKHF